MPMYDRSAPTGVEVVDEWTDGVGWMAHPNEEARRASHALRGTDGVWVFDPLDGPGVDEALADLGEVAGVAVLSQFHARDAGELAARHGVAVHVPAWMDRVADAVDAPVERYEAPAGEWVALGDSDIEVQTVNPTVAWREVVARRPTDGTLRVPDMLSSVPEMTVADERVGCYFVHRFVPPRDAFEGVDPNRLLFGHGAGVTDDAAAALDDALADARRNLPRALVAQAPNQLRGVIGALVE